MSFTTIDHDLRKKFNLSLNEYAICDSIYHLSRKQPCNASKEYLGEFIGVSRQAVSKIISKLIEKNLLVRVNNRLLITSEIWDNEILELHTGKKIDTECQESLHSSVKKVYTECQESLHNNNNNNNNNNNIYSRIFNVWNNQPNLISHRKIEPHLQKIKKSLTYYTENEIVNAIIKYNRITKLQNSLFSYKWILKDFLTRGLERFTTDQPDSDYLKKNLNNQKTAEELLNEQYGV